MPVISVREAERSLREVRRVARGHLTHYQAEVLAGRFDEYVERYCRIEYDDYVAALPSGRRRELARAAC